MTTTRLEADADRFTFGENWSRFLSVLDEGRIGAARESLVQKLGVTSLAGKRFLDAGSGSGLFSLCARRLDASAVVSFDYDERSVACTEELKRRFFPGDARWRVEQGSVLDAAYLDSLGQFDVVYSWGVLHHTGDMRTALDLVARRVAPGGRLFIAIYNDQGWRSRQWAFLKRCYNRWPWTRPFVVARAFLECWAGTFLKDALSGNPLRTWRQRRGRGMSPWYDLIDWAGGYPFEVAKPEDIFRFYRDRGFRLTEMRTDGRGLGCNEYIFLKE
jgi:2-polyprenyl-6-hydroxyphenyl methylase/3-demethylubiquinone-9 3-methyltransferase